MTGRENEMTWKKSKERKKREVKREGKEKNGKERKEGRGGERRLLVFRAGTAYAKLFGFRVGAPQCA